ncbi:MAG: YdjY domain-containing protein [Chloroherpetonaceae bacterium]|nr:YdjY domain-containing protein [Chloroherpetonaceae bacterium]MDW8437014.1 YdjY domain-containing protein [Chloroherpetonaceae bacterium]
MLDVNFFEKSVSFSGKILPSQFNAWTSWTKNHHFIVYKGGRAARNALIESDASDLDILVALESLGARSGDNLSIDAWEKRADQSSPEPDKRVEGSIIDVLVSWNDQEPLRANEIFDDKFGKGFLFKFGGHRALMSKWKSGCVACLQSCPGGRVSNANYTLRDYESGTAKFDARKDRLPKDATPVVVTLKVLDE